MTKRKNQAGFPECKRHQGQASPAQCPLRPAAYRLGRGAPRNPLWRGGSCASQSLSGPWGGREGHVLKRRREPKRLGRGRALGHISYTLTEKLWHRCLGPRDEDVRKGRPKPGGCGKVRKEGRKEGWEARTEAQGRKKQAASSLSWGYRWPSFPGLGTPPAWTPPRPCLLPAMVQQWTCIR